MEEETGAEDEVCVLSSAETGSSVRLWTMMDYTGATGLRVCVPVCVCVCVCVCGHGHLRCVAVSTVKTWRRINFHNDSLKRLLNKPNVCEWKSLGINYGNI